MVRQAARRNGAEEGDMPLWATKLIERFDAFSTTFERTVMRVIKTWNALPLETITARSTFVFNREEIFEVSTFLFSAMNSN
ncbi:unnamed protein product [Cylicocyclus nassatus]|uniref:Uncharacterized protein n=1 Tax=Cylicocyclus nassatus TaxID=53992 RepID=A0AA36GHC9_CYLNA|nr:unnamed protein product [Cylicocyclus nassatus]